MKNSSIVKDNIVEDNGVSDKAFSEDYLPYLVAKASYLLSQGINEYFKEFDTPISTWRVLTAVSEAEQSVGKLAKMVMLNQPTLSKALDKLEKAGLIVRKKDITNRRNVFIGITAKGQRMIEKLTPLVKAHEKSVFGSFSSTKQNEFQQLLKELIAKLEK